jgi:hypothetical protein
VIAVCTRSAAAARSPVGGGVPGLGVAVGAGVAVPEGVGVGVVGLPPVVGGGDVPCPAFLPCSTNCLMPSLMLSASATKEPPSPYESSTFCNSGYASCWLLFT